MGAVDACAVLGRALALDGDSLDEALDELRSTHRLVRGTEPDYDHVRAFSVAWSEATLGYLHRISCQDPVTGLASLAHLRCRLSELYRGELRGRRRLPESHALVVVDVRGSLYAGTATESLDADLRTARCGEGLRTVFDGSETVARLGPHRIVVLTERDPRLGQRVALVRRLLARSEVAARPVRVWIEGLPDTDDGAAILLGELARR